MSLFILEFLYEFHSFGFLPVEINVQNEVTEEPKKDEEKDIETKIGINNILKEGVDILDNFVDTDSENYRSLKSMIKLWNPESSKWAVQASKKYKMAMAMKGNAKSKDWFDEPKRDRRMKRVVYIDRCNCHREILAHTMVTYEGGDHGNKSISTCSHHSFPRGAKQKVVAFSFYGNPNSPQAKARKYFEGIKANLKELPEKYPDWVLRLYYDLPQDHYLMKDLCDLACNDPNIDLCHVEELPALGDVSKVFAMNWRFFPMLDPQVSHMLSRDLDSLISDREVSAVQEWLDSSKAFHFMRDNPSHSIEILGSGWGIRMSPLERSFVDAAFVAAVKDSLFWAPKEAYGSDQGFLKRYLWPWAKWNAISHDSYTCQKFPRTQAFPTQRKMEKNNFVASVIADNDMMKKVCPLKCRPKDHPDWEYC